MAGKKVGRWTVIEESTKADGDTHVRWICECECGTRRDVCGGSLRRGHSKSCGCLAAELTSERKDGTTHGMGNTPEHRAWVDLRFRCSNKNDRNYHHYGGRGIKVCKRWSSFEAFYEDMGARPSAKHSIDRIDNDGNYEPGNCRWATRKQQQSNRRNTPRITAAGVTLTIIGWSEITGRTHSSLFYRYTTGWPHEEIIFGRNLVDKPRLIEKIEAAKLNRP